MCEINEIIIGVMKSINIVGWRVVNLIQLNCPTALLAKADQMPKDDLNAADFPICFWVLKQTVANCLV